MTGWSTRSGYRSHPFPDAGQVTASHQNLSGSIPGIGARMSQVRSGLVISRSYPARRPKAACAVVACPPVDGTSVDGQTLDKVVGTSVPAARRRSSRSTTRPGRLRRIDRPGQRERAGSQLGDGPGHKDRPHPDRRVQPGRDRRHEEGDRGGRQGRRDEHRPRPSRQSGRCRERGDRRGQRVHEGRRGVPGPRRPGQGHPAPGERERLHDRQAARGSRRPRLGEGL